MQDNDNAIISDCPLFVCRICHTKTGHPHQKWCDLAKSEDECENCLYLNESNKLCVHPYKRKGGDPE